MKRNFRQIFAVAASALLVGMTAGVASAANYPQPFVSSAGSADFAVVHGASPPAAATDVSEATSVANQLLGLVTSSVSVGSEAVSFDTGSTRIWLNTSLNAAKSTLTKTDLPTILADYTFSGNVDSKMTSTLKVGVGTTAGADNSNKVIFARQPTSSDDPVIGISLSSDVGNVLYNASVTMPAINFSHSDSEGESIRLFGKDFVVSTATDATNLVLFKSAQEISLTAGGSSPSPSQTVTVDGTSYTVELVTGSGTTSATINVNGEQKSITAGSSKKINGLEVALKTVTESTALSTIDATLLLGSQKMTFTNGQKVKVGSDDTLVDGTKVTFTGANTGVMTGLTVSVFRPTSSTDAIVEGQAFVDPVFGGLRVVFEGISSPLSDSGRETLSIKSSGDASASLTFTDKRDNTATLDFAHNESNAFALRDTQNYTIHVREKENVSENQYVILGNEDYGVIAKVTQIYNDTGVTYTNDKVSLVDEMSGETYATTFTAEGAGTVTIQGKQYTVNFYDTGDAGRVVFSYPTSDSSATQVVVYPTIQTKNLANLALYEKLTSVNLTGLIVDPADSTGTAITGFKFPDGDGYTTTAVTYAGGNASHGNWTIGSSVIVTSTAADPHAVNGTAITIGRLSYFINGTTVVNETTIQLRMIDGTLIGAPSVVLWEGKDDSSNYEATVIELETTPLGTSANGVGVNTVRFTAPTQFSATKRTDTDLTEYVDLWGTYALLNADDSDQKIATLTYPTSQVYSKIYFDSTGATSNATQTGSVVVTAAELSSVQSKNLVVVGGSCVNSVAATLVGGAYCGSAWTSATGVGAGQFVIQSFANPNASGKVALLVAGYEREDTVNAATYLRNRPSGAIDTTVGKKYTGTTATAALTTVA